MELYKEINYALLKGLTFYDSRLSEAELEKRLDYLSISNFKNLRDFSIDFDETHLTSVLIGRNGTGKSNLIEALVIIFRDLDLDKHPSFSYTLKYQCRNHNIVLEADCEKNKYSFEIDKKAVRRSQFQQKKDEYLPNHLFTYYSGPSNRLESHFDDHQKRFYKELLDGLSIPLRRLFYTRLIHSQLVLLSYFSFDNDVTNDFLKKYFNIERLESVLIKLQEPSWAKPKKDDESSWHEQQGDRRFWNSRGVVQQFLNILYKISLAPLRRYETDISGFRKRSQRECIYLYIPDQNKLKQLANHYSNQQEFFKVLESTYISELIKEVRIRVIINNAGQITFKELSEGEQQLLTVLGLLRFTKDEESLFLLDEPDTHLNPAWKFEYLNLLTQIVGESDSSHIILCTHDPLVIGGLTKSQVKIFEKKANTDQIVTNSPVEDPRGMGVAALLTSELFGLSTTLDLETQKLLDRKRELQLKNLSGKINEEEKAEMRVLSDTLCSLDFTKTVRDPLYNKFINAINKREEFKKIVLTPEEVRQQEKIAKEIIDKILQEGKH